MKVFITCLTSICLLLACSSGPRVSSSGNKDMDQTASFTLHCVKQVKGRYKKPSSIVSYITSAMGKAELTPPSEELEPELASVYRGPRPGKGVYITIDKRNSVMPYSLQLEGDDSKNLIIAKAYKSGEAEPFHTWEWSL